ncbi:MAG: DPP IV N-terminal domain-containing protein, partial [Streptosporangiaceae bacterium]
MTDSFPRQEARTRRFSLGVPRAFRISPDGARIAFLRTGSGTDPVTCLWVLDVASGQERLAADPRTLGPYLEGTDEENLPPEERARRERVRESAGGIVAYATDRDVTLAVFALSGQVHTVPLTGAGEQARTVATQIPALDPRPDPTGRRLAYVCSGALRVTGLDGGDDVAVADPQGAEGVTFGLPEFIAAEEMDRQRGYWWSPAGSALLVARADETPVTRWHIADPAHPERTPAEVAYPAAGTPNAEVSLLLARLDGSHRPVETGSAEYPYLVTVNWEDEAEPLIVVQSRDQRRMRLLALDPGTGQTRVLLEDTDPHWLEIVPGVPARLPGGRIVWARDEADTRRLVVLAPGQEPAAVTPPGLQVRGMLDVDGEVVLFSASAEPTEVELWTWGPDGQHQAVLQRAGQGGGVEGGTRAGGTTVSWRRDLDTDGVTVTVHRDALPPPHPPTFAGAIASYAERPLLPEPRPVLLSAGPREIRTAVLFPS